MAAHIVPIRIYRNVSIALFVLLIVTVAFGFLHLGPFNAVVALIIAGIKAALVGVFFMHLRYSSPVMRLFAAAGLLWLATLIGLTLSDYLSRW